MQTFVVPTKWFAKATALARITALPPQENTILDHVLCTLEQDNIQLMSTNEVTACSLKVPLAVEIPDLEDTNIQFLVRADSLSGLLSEIDTDTCTLIVDTKKQSLKARVQSSDLTLPLRNTKAWSDISDRFVLEPDSADLSIPLTTLENILSYNKFFLSSGQDIAMHLIELRDGQAMSSDRVKFGYYATPIVDDIELKIQGDLVASIDKAISFFPKDAEIKIQSSDAYNILYATQDKFEISIGFIKCAATLPDTLDKVPDVEEPDQAQIDRVYLVKALSRLAIVAPKNDARVKFVLSSDATKSKITITVTNELGQESRDVIPVTRTLGDIKTSPTTVLPLAVFQKFLKLSTSPSMTFKFFDKKYLKVCDTSDTASTFSIFQSLPEGGS